MSPALDKEVITLLLCVPLEVTQSLIIIISDWDKMKTLALPLGKGQGKKAPLA